MKKQSNSNGLQSGKLKVMSFHTFLLVLFVFLFQTAVYSQFITKWRTSTDGESITIPTFNGSTYDYTVDWGDGNTVTGYTDDAVHIYTDAGDYTVSITGTFPRIYIANNDDMRHKILSIEAWGNNSWTSMNAAFEGADLLVCNANDAPVLTNVTDLSDMFKHTTNFEGDLNSWNVSTITNMSGMFYASSIFDGDLNNWNVSAVENMSEMFYYAQGFNGNVDNWVVTSVTNMYQMFAGANVFNRDISGWNVNTVTNMEGMFNAATIFNQDLSGWSVGNVTNMSHMFSYARDFNSNISGWDVSSVVDMNHMFDLADSFDKNLGNWNLSSVNGKHPVYGMSGMLNHSGLSETNYDNTLIGWDNGGYTDNELGADGLVYCSDAAKAARTSLLNDHGWSITGDSDCAPAPVELLNFKAVVINYKMVELIWQTASEKDNNGFEIQKSDDGNKWETIGFKEGSGDNVELMNYSFLDENPYSGANYYRLKQMDFNGSFEYSSVVSAIIKGEKLDLQLYPNPSRGEINLVLETDNNNPIIFTLTDYLGRVIWKKSAVDLGKVFYINENGVFFLTAQSNNEVYMKRIVVN